MGSLAGNAGRGFYLLTTPFFPAYGFPNLQIRVNRFTEPFTLCFSLKSIILFII